MKRVLRPLKFFLVLVLSFSLKGCNVPTSHFNDDSLYAGASGEFATVFRAINAKCAYCHRHTGWASKTTPSDWINQPDQSGNALVIAGDPDASSLYNSLRRANVAGARADMPRSGASNGDLTDAEFLAIKEWIESL